MQYVDVRRSLRVRLGSEDRQLIVVNVPVRLYNYKPNVVREVRGIADADSSDGPLVCPLSIHALNISNIPSCSQVTEEDEAIRTLYDFRIFVNFRVGVSNAFTRHFRAWPSSRSPLRQTQLASKPRIVLSF